MSVRFAVLGSGSSGNATLMEFGDGVSRRRILLDAGLSPRDTGRRLARFGVTIDDLDAILLTHLDRDHFRPTWARACERHDIRVHLHRRHFRVIAGDRSWRGRVAPFDDDGFELDGGVAVEPVRLAHDALGTVGYVLQSGAVRFGFATDLGRVSDLLLERFINLDALAIESNYDRRMQLTSSRPGALKSRIMGGSGHLSNVQALEAVLHIAERSQLRRVALLHLSRQCNDPSVVRRLYSERAPHLAKHLTITDQFVPTPMLDLTIEPVGAAPPPMQPTLF